MKLLKKPSNNNQFSKTIFLRPSPEVYDTSDNQNKLGLCGVPKLISEVLQCEISDVGRRAVVSIKCELAPALGGGLDGRERRKIHAV